MENKCEHEWVFENRMLLSNPPQQNKICRKCKKTSTDTIGEMTTDEYSKIIA